MGKAKDYLRQIRKLDIMISQRIKERDSLRQFDGVSGIAYSGDTVQSSPSGHAPFEKTVERIIQIEEELDRMIDEFIDTRSRIIGEIQQLDNDVYVDLLFKRYVEYKPFTQIAKEMDYDYYWICTLHGRALKEFESAQTNTNNGVL